MIRLSSGLCSAMITSYGLGLMMQYGHIRVFTGTQPVSANHPETGVRVATVCQDGVMPAAGLLPGGLEFIGGVVPGTLLGHGTWKLRGTAAGAPGWWRFVWNSVDEGGPSMELPRIDGLVGESMLMPAGVTSVNASTLMVVPRFTMTMPSQA